MKQFRLIPEFEYLWNCLFYREKNQKWSIDVINMVGSRKSGKTDSICIFIAICCLKFKTAVYVGRYLSKDLLETTENFLQILDKLGFYYNYKKSERLVKFSNGSFIKFKALHQTNDKNAKMTGIASAPDENDIIIWEEEAFEFKPNDFTMFESAIRGGNGNKLVIKSCNPFLITNKYIEYCNTHLQFNKQVLGNIGEQYTVKLVDLGKKKSREIFHYSNWKINTYLNKSDQLQLEKIKTQTPYLADASYYGIPGALGGLIFNAVMYRIKEPNFICNEFIGGIDYGTAESNTTANLWGRNKNTLLPVKIDEWYNDNETRFMEPTDMAISICKFYENLANQLPQLKRDGLTVYVDYSATGFLSILKEKTRQFNLDSWLTFEKCFKPDVLFAINMFYTAISNQYIYMVKDSVPNTLREYNTMAWDVKDTTDDVKPIKKWDHTFDSDKYALFTSGWIYDLELISDMKGATY